MAARRWNIYNCFAFLDRCDILWWGGCRNKPFPGRSYQDPTASTNVATQRSGKFEGRDACWMSHWSPFLCQRQRYVWVKPDFHSLHFFSQIYWAKQESGLQQRINLDRIVLFCPEKSRELCHISGHCNVPSVCTVQFLRILLLTSTFSNPNRSSNI